MTANDAPKADAEQSAAAALLDELERTMRETPVAQHVRSMLATLSALALQRLGQAKGSEEHKDLQQAHLAIEAFRALSQVLVEVGKDENEATYKEMLTTMQLAFVRELGKPETKEE